MLVRDFALAFINTFTYTVEMPFFVFELAEMHPILAVEKYVTRQSVCN